MRREWERLCKKYETVNPRLVIVFGSRARGDHLEHSDLDVLVVADSLPSDPRRAFELLYDPEDPLITPIGLNTQLFMKKLNQGSAFILEILEDGIVICGDPDFKEQVLETYRSIRRCYMRIGKTWIKMDSNPRQS